MNSSAIRRTLVTVLMTAAALGTAACTTDAVGCGQRTFAYELRPLTPSGGPTPLDSAVTSINLNPDGRTSLPGLEPGATYTLTRNDSTQILRIPDLPAVPPLVLGQSAVQSTTVLGHDGRFTAVSSVIITANGD